MNGLLLKGDGAGHFTPLSILQSGIFIPGNGKGLAKLRSADNSYLLVSTQNRGPVQVFKNKKASKLIPVLPNVDYCVIEFANGKKQKMEFNYGSSFLSQSGRFVCLTPAVERCSVTNNKGETREIRFDK